MTVVATTNRRGSAAAEEVAPAPAEPPVPYLSLPEPPRAEAHVDPAAASASRHSRASADSSRAVAPQGPWGTSEYDCSVVSNTVELQDDPDLRLRFYTHVAATAAAAAEKREGNLELWMDTLLKGVQDPWSRVRAAALDGMHHVLAHCLDGPAAGDADATSPPSRKASTASPARTPLRGHSKRPSAADAVAPAACQRDRLLHHLVSLMVKRWGSADTPWYVRQGLLRLAAVLTPHARGDDQALHVFAQRMCLPALAEVQRPVREAAVDLLAALVQHSPALATYATDHVVRELGGLHVPPPNTPMDAQEEAAASAMEGLLQAALRLADLGLIKTSEPPISSLIVIFAAHPASNIRQCVAEALRPPSDDLFVYLLVQLADFPYSDEAQPWQAEETVLMALQQHLRHYLSLADDSACSVDLSSPLQVSCSMRARNYYRTTADLMRYALTSLVLAAASKRFEVARMGKQVLPLFLQFWTRYVERTTDLLEGVCKVVTDGDLNDKEHVLLEDLALPALWWYLAVRRVVRGEAEHVSAAVAPYLTLTSPLLRRPGGQFVSTSLLLATTYFAAHCPPELRAAALQPAAWQPLLTIEQDAGLRYGMDFALAYARSEGLLALLPLWLRHLPALQPHLQGVVLAMVDAALRGGGAPPRPFRFAYTSAFAAPAMLDGGEDLPLGYVWLRAKYPTNAACPPLALPPDARDAGGVAALSAEAHDALVDRVLATLYVEPGTEQAVVREVRALMLVLARPPARVAAARLLQAVVERLDRVSPAWRTGGVAATTVLASSLHDWDDDDDEGGEGMVDTVNAAAELREAKALMATLEQTAAPEDWQAALAALDPSGAGILLSAN
ncbi:hypothetical protein STCU_08187 [Strigomonas culicis]|uniref:Uncharacterized protein n=1 Tax=Strigomonas culicis TaxID=28005 RepID=S9TW25_9TRYP|nr:hypothetical protein STCU_08187 [Strigomonas culicis]|eukprot:EPY22657.1 hypothetical protein STCU_08187 [Strigomonas culicis]